MIGVRGRRGRCWTPSFIAVVAVSLLGAAATAGSASALSVRGNRLTDGRGRTVVLRGINRSGLEYACIQGYGFFDSPHTDRIDDAGMIAAMKSWAINAVRVPLNEDCWLGTNASAAYSGARYRTIVAAYVRALRRAGLYVVLDLHWAAPGHTRASSQLPMADADHGPAFWRSVAGTFRHEDGLVFDLFNEPYGIGWSCWLHGCRIPARSGAPAYASAGMQSLVDAVRASGARQPLLLGGLDYASDDAGWLAHAPHDPAHALIASEHNYGGLSPCGTACRSPLQTLRAHVPVTFGELGETDCAHGYIDRMMAFADHLRIGYLGWAWDAVSPGGWTCKGGPSLITGYSGTPTAFGVGLRDHLRALARHG